MGNQEYVTQLENRIKALEKELATVRSQASAKVGLATMAAKKARNVAHVVAIAETFLEGDGFNYRGEKLDAKGLVERLTIDPEYSNLFGGGDGNSTASANPFAKGPGFSLTRQMEIMRSNPSLAATLKAAAGVK